MEVHILGKGVEFMIGERGWGREKEDAVYSMPPLSSGQQQLDLHQKGLKKGPNTGLSLHHNAIICSIVFYTHLQSREDVDLWIFTQVSLKAPRGTQLVMAGVNEWMSG